MKAAIVGEHGVAPTYGDFDAPTAATGEQIVEVASAALSPVTRSRASGAHYSASGTYPLIPGIDGVGRRGDGAMVYFVMPRAPYGGMAEFVPVRDGFQVTLPRGLEPVKAAAIANPGMSSWAACEKRARLKAGETVLVNGATGAAGRLAVQIARHMGAARVIATGRDAAGLDEVSKLGADATIALTDDADALEGRFAEHFAEGVDVVIDYLWGVSAERLLIAAAKAGRDAVPMRFVQVGSASGEAINLPGAVLRSSAIELMGSGIGSIPLGGLMEAIGALFAATIEAGFEIATRAVPLDVVESAWQEKAGRERLVFTMGA